MVLSDVISGLALFSLLYSNVTSGEIRLYVVFAIRFVLSLIDVFYSPATMVFFRKLLNEMNCWLQIHSLGDQPSG